MRHTINSVPIATTRTYQEGQYWRWYIRDINGREYIDGGNYLIQDVADEGLHDAYDRQAIPSLTQ